MQLRSEQLQAHLAKGLGAAYAIHGDEPLLALEAADAIRAAARKRGFADREVFEPGRGFDWSEFQHALASQSLFGAQLHQDTLSTGLPAAASCRSICCTMSFCMSRNRSCSSASLASTSASLNDMSRVRSSAVGGT